MTHTRRLPFAAALLLAAACLAPAQEKIVIPHAQDKAPGPALTPREALAKMKVPDGFTIELVAAEPDVVNPVAMAFDEKGRIWVTESFEYPRREPGPGRDRIKILEDTDLDGKVDKVTIFAEGLNIPSGIAVGHGGVWVGNSPDILFLKDTDGDGKADHREVIVTGFGRTDTHELPNAFTWGPDGFLYGLNGVFNHSDVTHRGRNYKFTCAMFRINPRKSEDGKHDFDLFCEGTSNPWGIAFDGEGSAFVSACVIDHLWHLVETGYYLRQGGPYPPFTWHIGSIVKHRHQKAAYCGLVWFDSDAYPDAYRRKLYMGNIHGNAINTDSLTRKGATYFAEGHDDLIQADDAWFMPVAQKVGPDGCLYVLDWYDRYHCYQDANRDPAGIDRAKGRLYRLRHKDSPRPAAIDLAAESDDQLIKRLAHANVFIRETARRLLNERMNDATRGKLESLVVDSAAPRHARLHALWAMIGAGSLSVDFHRRLLEHEDATFRGWAVRAAGNFAGSMTTATAVSDAVRDKALSLAADKSPDVLLQVAVAAPKFRATGIDPMPTLIAVLKASGEDDLIPHIVWQNLHPMLADRGKDFLQLVSKEDLQQSPNLKKIMPRVTERILAAGKKSQ